MRSLTFRLFTLFCYVLDRFVYKPLFWFLIVSLLFGMNEIKSGFRKRFYVSTNERLLTGLIFVGWAVLLIWYYWFNPSTRGVIRF